MYHSTGTQLLLNVCCIARTCSLVSALGDEGAFMSTEILVSSLR